MQSKITDILVNDYLPSEGMAPLYDFNSKFYKGLFIDNMNLEIGRFSNKKNILLPLIDLKEPWLHPSWPDIPSDLFSALKQLFLYSLIECSDKFNSAEVSSMEEGLELADEFYGSYKEMSLSHLLTSKDVIASNVKYLLSKRMDRSSIGADNFPKNIVMCFPQPEHTGVLTSSFDYKKFGAFVILNNIFVFELSI